MKAFAIERPSVNENVNVGRGFARLLAGWWSPSHAGAG